MGTPSYEAPTAVAPPSATAGIAEGGCSTPVLSLCLVLQFLKPKSRKKADFILLYTFLTFLQGKMLSYCY